MKYRSFSDLPRALQRYAAQFGWDSDEMERWLHQPIPRLAGRSVLQALEDGHYSSVYQVFLRVADAMGIKGLPEDFE
jgi:cytochrome c2